MGASSSSTAKNRRKVSLASGEDGHVEGATRRASRLLMQNGQLMGDTGEWHTKAHSMYELQRERSMEATSAAAAGGVDETEREHNNGNNNNCTNNVNGIGKEAPATKASPMRRKSIAASKRDEAAGQRQSPRPGDVSGASPPQNSNPTQRRRPLTWAWLRGHEVSLPGTTAEQATLKKSTTTTTTTATAMAANRRRSLKVGNESSLAVHANSSADWGIQRQFSTGSASSTAVAASTSVQHHNPLVRRASQGRPLLAQLGRQKSIRKSDAGLGSAQNPISALGREIIQFCFDQPHNEIGVRICSRLLEKRPDFRGFVYTMGKERWLQMTARLKDFLETVVRRVDNSDLVERLARKYGEEHVELKCFGFKPDFWVSLADAITVECVILDQATHQPSDTITAWSLLVSIMFSAVRDGYYQAMRAQRISQRHRNVNQRESALKGGLTAHHGSGGVEKSASANELQSPTNRKTYFKLAADNELSEEAEWNEEQRRRQSGEDKS